MSIFPTCSDLGLVGLSGHDGHDAEMISVHRKRNRDVRSLVNLKTIVRCVYDDDDEDSEFRFITPEGMLKID